MKVLLIIESCKLWSKKCTRDREIKVSELKIVQETDMCSVEISVLHYVFCSF